MLPIELYLPIFSHINDRQWLISASTLSKSLQPTVESLLWTRLSLLRTFSNNNPSITTKKLELARTRVGKYVKRVELSLWYLVQWATWDRTEDGCTMQESVRKLIDTLNSLSNVDRMRLLDMDEQSAPDEISTILLSLSFPRLKRVYYLGSFTPSLYLFLTRHEGIRTLYVGMDSLNRSHSFSLTPTTSARTTILPNLAALECTTPVVHTLLPLIDPHNSPLNHVTISFGHHGYFSTNISSVSTQITHLEVQNELVTGLVFPTVSILRLNDLNESAYSSALSALLPRFPNLLDLSHVLLSASSLAEIISLLPTSLEHVHFIYEGVMWGSEFDKVVTVVKDRCPLLQGLELWAWTEAYYDLWGCNWSTGSTSTVSHKQSKVLGGTDVSSNFHISGGEIWNVKTYGQNVVRSPAVLWI